MKKLKRKLSSKLSIAIIRLLLKVFKSIRLRIFSITILNSILML